MPIRLKAFVIAAFGGLGLAVTSQLSLADRPEFLSCGTEGCGESATTCSPEDVCGEDSCGESLFGTIEPLTRSKASGDWFGLRPHLKESGVTVDANVAQFYMGAVSGGLDNSGRYSGHGDYVVNIDGDKALGMKGMFIKLRAEHLFGQSLGGVSCCLSIGR